MAESQDKPKKEAGAGAPAGDSPKAGKAAEPPPPPVQIPVDDSKAQTTYSNYYRVAGMAEELIIDFGLNTQPFGVPTDPIPINMRVVINFYTAKRMLHALQLAIQRHEAAFGVLETDIQKRVRPGVMGTPPSPPPK